MIDFKGIGVILEEKDIQIYKKFHQNSDQYILLTDQINKIGAFKCKSCPDKDRKPQIMTLSHIEDEHLNRKFDNESLLIDLMKEKKIFKVLNEFGEEYLNF